MDNEKIEGTSDNSVESASTHDLLYIVAKHNYGTGTARKVKRHGLSCKPNVKWRNLFSKR